MYRKNLPVVNSFSYIFRNFLLSFLAKYHVYKAFTFVFKEC